VSKTLTRRKKLAFGCLTFWFFFLLCEILCAVLWMMRFPTLEAIRQQMMGSGSAVALQHNAIEQPYLSYIPAPGYTNQFGQQHNEQGYRGPAVPMRRKPNTVRVLCMGGSTTYGWLVEKADETWPAHLQRLLEAQKPAGCGAVEVINAGLPQGTTAEIYTHYAFKFHYYQPDLVILNTGGNDALPVNGPVYQPDYSHWRRQLHNVEPLPPQSRWMMHSRLLSTFVIVLFRYEYISGNSHTWELGHTPATTWYPELDARQGAKRPIPDDELAFKQNLDDVLDMIQDDGHKAVLVAFRLTANSTQPDEFKSLVDRNERVLKAVAEARRLPFAPFPEACITPGNWMDDCHLNGPGSKEKAEHILPYAMQALWGTLAP